MKIINTLAAKIAGESALEIMANEAGITVDMVAELVMLDLTSNTAKRFKKLLQFCYDTAIEQMNIKQA